MVAGFKFCSSSEGCESKVFQESSTIKSLLTIVVSHIDKYRIENCTEQVGASVIDMCLSVCGRYSCDGRQW